MTADPALPWQITSFDREEMVRYREAGREVQAPLGMINGVTILHTWHLQQWQFPAGVPLTQQERELVRERIVEWLERDSDFPVVCDESPPETREQMYQRLRRECPPGWEVVIEGGTIIQRRTP